MTMLQEAGIIDQPLIPDFKKHNDGTLGIIDGFFQTLVYNPYAQMNIFMVKDALDNFLNTVKSYYYGFLGISIYDPLALDLNGDGKIGISPAPNGGAYFDHNGDGVSHKSSWISKEDGILAYDRNGNGKIDDGSELFGNFTQIKDKDGNQRLAKHGTNELKTLDELNIKSLNLNYNEVNQDLGDNNTLTLKGSYTKTNGTAQAMDISQTTKKLIKETIWTTSIARMLG